MREYELGVVIHPDLEIDLEPTRAKLQTIITQAGGVVKAADEWGKHKLAYPINKQDFGIYHFYQIQIEPAGLAELEKAISLATEVIRHQIVKPEVISAKKAAKRTKQKPTSEENGEGAEKPAKTKAKIATRPKASDNKKSATPRKAK